MYVFLFSVLLSLSSTVHADDGIADLKLLCSNPGRFHNQLPPSEIMVNCYDQRFEWIPTGHEDSTFANHRKICTVAVANKPGINVPRVCTDCSHFPTPNSCPGFKEVCKEVELSYKVRCEDIMGMPSVFMFCFNRLNQEIAATDEKIMEVKETGKTKKLCGVQNFVDGKPANLDWSLTQIKK